MADYQYLTATGTVVPDTSQLLSELQNEFKQIFGQDLVVSADTPQGVLITALTLARAAVVTNNAALANMLNPNLAVGDYLDAIMQFTGMQRTPATRTLVSGVTLTGVPGTLISEGTQAQTAVGDVFETLSAVTIGGGGSITVDFRAVEYGPIPCGVGDLNQVVTNVLGWETVNNTNAGVLGTATQSDQAARAKRNNTLSFQNVSIAGAIISALYNVEGVESLSFQENTANTTQSINGISMVAKSVWACVEGGSDLDIASALLENKSAGAAWNGAESVAIVEPASGQNYTVLFDRPDPIEFLVRVTTPNGDTQNIKDAILAWAAGNVSQLAGLVVGTDVSPFEISAAINSVYPEIFVSKVEITLASAPTSWSTDVLEIAVNELAYTTASDITVIAP